MDWNTLYPADTQPSKEQFDQYIATPLWQSLTIYLQENFKVEPQYSYSSCSGQPGWNVKYKKSGRSLCTLYPMPGFFIALVVVGTKEQQDAELALPTLSKYLQELYSKTSFSAGGRWLMIQVTSEEILNDVKQLIQLRQKSK